MVKAVDAWVRVAFGNVFAFFHTFLAFFDILNGLFGPFLTLSNAKTSCLTLFNAKTSFLVLLGKKISRKALRTPPLHRKSFCQRKTLPEIRGNPPLRKIRLVVFCGLTERYLKEIYPAWFLYGV